MRIRYIAEMVNIDVDAVSDKGKQQARRAFVDTIGVCFPGLRGELYQNLIRYADLLAEGSIPVPRLDKKLTDRDAAVLWGALEHAIDYDDSCPALCGHPSVVLLTVSMICAAQLHKSGKEALEAYICGYEAMNRMAVNAAKEQYATGWHTTTTVGIFGGVVAACRLYGCTVEETENAMGIAASMAAGIQFNFGSMTKPLHPGFTSQNAITAAQLAKHGIDASPRAFLDEGLSYFGCYGGSVKEVPAERRFIEEGITVKPYPSCGCTTRPNYMAVTAFNEGIHAEDIARIDCRICTIDENCLSYPQPAKGSEAKFSLEYGIARCLLNGTVGLKDFEDENVQAYVAAGPTKDLMAKIFHSIPDDLADRPFYEAYNDLEITLKNGEKHRYHVEDPLGFPGNPMTDEDIHRKFLDCAQTEINGIDAEALYQMLIHVDRQESMADILQFMCDIIRK